jgi:hypothetical protein
MTFGDDDSIRQGRHLRRDTVRVIVIALHVLLPSNSRCAAGDFNVVVNVCRRRSVFGDRNHRGKGGTLEQEHRGTGGTLEQEHRQVSFNFIVCDTQTIVALS